jgi:basic membrane protein A
MKFKKSISLIVMSVMLCSLLVGCGSKAAQDAPAPAKEEAKKLKVGLLLSGPISDMGWNASAYDGLLKAKQDFNVETSYQENVQQSDMEEVLRNYATQGFNIIIGHGFQFGDATKKVAKEFPDVKFVVTSSNISQGPNVSSVNIDNELQGFMMGSVAALMTKSNVVGSIGGQDIPPIKGSLKGYDAGAKYVNPNIKILSTLTGSFDDVAKTKETAMAMIGQGADVIMTNANQAGLGSIEACKAKGIYAIGSNKDQNDLAPDTVVVSGIKSVPVLISFVVEKVQKNELKPQFYNLGINEGAVFLSSFHGFESKIPKETMDKINKIMDDLKNNKITYK